MSDTCPWCGTTYEDQAEGAHCGSTQKLPQLAAWRRLPIVEPAESQTVDHRPA